MVEQNQQNGAEILPREFGKYHLIERIASGGMAELYRAKLFGAGGFEKDLAIKKVLPQLARDESFIKMFMDEAMITVTLNHGNIVSVIDFGQLNGEYFLVMEFIDGVDVQSLIRKSQALGDPFPAYIASYIAIEACKGLDYAHRKVGPDGRPLEIVHRDISPQNILISFEGEVKIVDFGIARAASRITSTQAGIVKGKLAYMAPEQIGGGNIDRRADIYALGVSLYEMLTLRRPFEGVTPQETLAAITRGDYEPAHKINRKVDRKLSAIVSRALEQNVKRRYQTAGEMAAELAAYLHRAGVFPDSATLAAFISQRLPEARPRTLPPTPIRAIRGEGRPPSGTGMLAAPAAVPAEKAPEPAAEESAEAVSFDALGLGGASPEPADSKRPTDPERPAVSDEPLLRAKTILLPAQEEAQPEPAPSSPPAFKAAPSAQAPTAKPARINPELAGAKTMLLSSEAEEPPLPVQQPAAGSQKSSSPTNSEVMAAAWLKQGSSSEDIAAEKKSAPKLIKIAIAFVALMITVGAAVFILQRSEEPQKPVVPPREATQPAVAPQPLPTPVPQPVPEPAKEPAPENAAPPQPVEAQPVANPPSAAPPVEQPAQPKPPVAQAVSLQPKKDLARVEPPKQPPKVNPPAVKSPQVKTAQPAVKEQPRPTAAVQASGTLRINSEPFAVIFLNGKPLGPTPQLNLKLPAGSHTLVLKNDALKLEKKVRVVIEPNKVQTMFVELNKP